MQNQKINKNFVIVLLGILAALGPFTIDMYLPAFGRIAEDLFTDDKRVAFTLTSYFIGISIGQLYYGPIVDKYGRKKPLIFGLLLYAIASLGCAFSFSIEMMILMRLIQALGGCVGMVASASIISDVFEIKDRARAFSYIVLVMGIAPLIAPSIGSFFLEFADWYFIFYFLAAFSALVCLMIYFFLPETSIYMHSNKLKPKRIFLNYLGIFRNRVFLFYTAAGSIVMSILFAYLSSASFIFLNYYGLSTQTFSILFAINASGLIIGSYINGIVSKKINYIKIGKLASAILTLISLIVSVIVMISPDLDYRWVVAGLFLILFIIGFINPNATAASLIPFTAKTGAASALNGAIRMGVAALVTALIGLVQGESAIIMFLMIFILSALTLICLWFAPKVDLNKKSE